MKKRLEEYDFLVNTHHIDDEDGLLHRVNRVVVRKGVIVAYRSLVTAGKIRGWRTRLQYTLQM